jgi:hypothetical protein
VGPELYKEAEGRATSALLAQLRTDHCRLNHYLYEFKKVEGVRRGMCGYEKETVEHFLVEFPSFWRERCELRSRVSTGRMRIATLLGEKEAVRAIMEYISATGRFKKET